MYALVGDRWDDGYLDEWAGPGACRIRVEAWIDLCRVDDAYFVQPRDWRRVWNYVREIGPVAVARKVASRQKEAGRNRKFLGVGLGRVVSGSFAPDTEVIFLAPLHPAAAERVVTDARLVAPADAYPGLAASLRASTSSGAIAHSAIADAPGLPSAWDDLAGWHPASERPLDSSVVADAWSAADAAVARASLAWTHRSCVPTPIHERRDTSAAASGRRTALFGYGQYAKTVILPNLDRGLSVVAVHEVDPVQLRTVDLAGVACDTSPWPRPSDRYDVYFAAGYHHTHAPIAEHALGHGAVAIVEKPPVTTRAQLEALIAAWSRGGQLHVCFQRRYSAFSAFARQDLGGGPLTYRCHVYEVPLPRRHWYRWPSSRGRVVSNGCHWIDHFLFMNDFAAVTRYDAWRASNGDAVCMAELANGSTFAMHLTDHGSNRIGMQNTIEMRAGGVTVTTVNDTHYRAEDDRRVLRSATQNKMAAFTAMYRTISARASTGQPTDTPASLASSAGLMLDFDDLLEGRR